MGFKESNLYKLQKDLIGKEISLEISETFHSESKGEIFYRVRLWAVSAKNNSSQMFLTIGPSVAYIKESYGYTIEDACGLLLEEDFRKTKEVQLY